MCNGDTDIYIKILQIQASLVCLKANSGMVVKTSELRKNFRKMKAGCCIHLRDRIIDIGD